MGIGLDFGPAAGQPRPLLCTVMALSLVGEHLHQPENRTAVARLTSELVNKALRGVPQSARISTSEAQGAATCFLGAPEDALHSALLLRDLSERRFGELLSVRLCLHLGWLRILSQSEQGVHAEGGALNTAQSLLDIARNGQLLASRPYRDLVTNLTTGHGVRFESLGRREDPEHGELEVYDVAAVRGGLSGPPRDGGHGTLDAEVSTQVEAELRQRIGPLARTLVGRLAPRSASAAELRQTIARALPDAGAQASSPAPARVPARTAPATDPHTTRQIDVTPHELMIIEHMLLKFLGKQARALTLQAMQNASTRQQLIDALAAHIEHPQQREVFLAAVARALPGR
ncbi:MAG: hypothetical protein Q7T63_10975 [Burkholderiaceae bacterium]|nr:hypothetical protein [Burkholderiaceae bacterium]MDO9090531.1 hypothetical protein [Burkholderiaceae bacterium]